MSDEDLLAAICEVIESDGEWEVSFRAHSPGKLSVEVTRVVDGALVGHRRVSPSHASARHVAFSLRVAAESVCHELDDLIGPGWRR